MGIKVLFLIAITALLHLPAIAMANSEPPSREEMWRVIQQQQREIELLKRQLQSTEQKVEATGEAIDTMQAGGGADAEEPDQALGASHSPFEHGGDGRTIVGGYGELHYNNLEGKGGANDKDEIDFHRLILFIGHQFNERIRFFSEIEYEHADTGSNGSVEIEQAYLEFDLNDQNRARAGLFLVPVGIINETHEPPSFYGVERNPVERNIIPATWWVGGTALRGEFASGWSYDVALHEGLNTSAGDSYAVRKGRQKTSEAIADDLAATARLKWTGYPGVEIAGSFQYQADVTQGTDSSAGSANLYEVHAIWNRGPFGLRALYALWDLDGSGPKAIGADEQKGFYVEPSYKFNDKFGIFTRFNQWDNAAGSGSDSEKQQWDIGLNWWPHPDVVIKADYQNQDNDDGKDQDGVNLGVGYQF